MTFLNRIFRQRRRPEINHLSYQEAWTGPGRELRSFDIETIAPYDHAGLVAFLSADKLSELTPTQIKIFLLLRDTNDPSGLTAMYIAEWLKLPARSVCACLRVLDAKGYASRIEAKHRNTHGAYVATWICNRGHWAADEEFLFWEFERL